MRRFVMAVMMLGAAQTAQAADMPDFPVLRGGVFPDGLSSSRTIWQGAYIGAQAAVGQSDMNFTGATRTIAANMLDGLALEAAGQVSQWPLLGKTSQRGDGWGGFAGYNSQWDDVVIGLELSYIHGKFGGSDTGRMGRSIVDSGGYTNSVTYEASGKVAISDIGTFRARAGYAFDRFLPYMFGGVALGQADIVRTARISGRAVNTSAAPGFTNIPFDYSKTDAQYSHLLYGYTAGVGIDVNLIGSLFLRAEWEYIRFTSTVDTNINTVRAGVGYKF
ncbi:MAG: outer membrane beta-barrel protein [Tardiphaga sp.]